jgi:alcohol dehydrogenase
MKVAVFTAKQTIKIEDRPIPRAGPGQAVVKIKYNGICGGDKHLFFSMDPPMKSGIVLGHENVATVYELGEGVNGFAVGDRVIPGPPGPCGECYYCLHGHSNICVKAFPLTNGIGVDGGEAEYMLVRDAKNMLFKIPDNVSFEDAVLTDPFATAYRGILTSNFRLGDNVVVSGAGPIGLAAIQFLKVGGAHHVTVLQKSAPRAAVAKQMGADLVLNPGESGVIEKIKYLYDGIGADVVFEAAGQPDSFELCLKLVKCGGQVLNLGTTDVPARVVAGQMVGSEVEIKNSLAYGGDEIKKVLSFMSSGRITPKPLFSGIVPLIEVVEKGFSRLAADKSLIKLVIAP